jgi:long-subunit acyl-CoA synthetase (AMP-forming)
MEARDSIPQIMPLGRPMHGRQVLVLDDYGQQVLPDGRSTGEIHLGGVSIFSGYVNQPEDSARVLIPLPQRDGLYYRTGDLGKINIHGEIVFVGRIDFQIKLRGQRIELTEIEAVIMRSSLDITNCVVVKFDHENLEHLVAYVETTAIEIDILHDECSKQLPFYMVPSLFVSLNHFPLNSNGKLDRRALQKPDLSSLLSSLKSMVNDEQQRTEMERRIATIWCRVLHLQSIPLTTISLFKLGGNSLVLMKLHHAYQTQFQQSLDVSDLFRRATIADHARLLEEHQERPAVESNCHSLNVIEGKSCARFNKEEFSFGVL